MREAISDAGPFWFHYILDVSPDEPGTLVRYIRIAPLDSTCPNTVTLKVAEARVRDKSPQQVAGGIDPCEVGLKEFHRGLEESGRHEPVPLTDTALWNVVAQCGSSERVFHFPYPEQIHLQRLKKDWPEVDGLWELEGTVVKKVFGEHSVFYDIPKQRDMELQRQGEALLPELRSGRFDEGFQDYCSHPEIARVVLGRPANPPAKPCDRSPLELDLAGYHGPIEQVDQTPKLLGESKFHFLNYIAPEFPPLAKMARIQGDVELALTVDRETGQVVGAVALSGHPILVKSAVAAAKKWRFDPKAQPEVHPIRIVLDYAFGCP